MLNQAGVLQALLEGLPGEIYIPDASVGTVPGTLSRRNSGLKAKGASPVASMKRVNSGLDGAFILTGVDAVPEVTKKNAAWLGNIGAPPHLPVCAGAPRPFAATVLCLADCLLDVAVQHGLSPAEASPIPSLTRTTSELVANWMSTSLNANQKAVETQPLPVKFEPPKLVRSTSDLVAQEWGVSKAEARRRLNKMAEVTSIYPSPNPTPQYRPTSPVQVHAVMAVQNPAAGTGGETDPYVGKQVQMVRGKYKGRSALVQRKVKKKWRLQVEGVEWGLEFYDNMFKII